MPTSWKQFACICACLAVVNFGAIIAAVATPRHSHSTAHRHSAFPRYTITDLGTRIGIDPEDFEEPMVLALNIHGDIASSVHVSGEGKNAIWRAAVIHDMALRLLPEPKGFTCSYASGINDLGDVSGYGENVNYEGEPVRTTDSAFVWKADGVHALPGNKNDMVAITAGINDNCEVVGYTRASDLYPVSFETHPVIWAWTGKESDDITPTLVPTFDDGESYGTAINNLGWIAGYSNVDARDPAMRVTHAFLSKGGVLSEIGSTKGKGSFSNNTPMSLNDRGEIVGYSTMVGEFEDIDPHAFLYYGKMMGLGRGKPYSINNNGQIVGTSSKHAVIWIDGQKRALDSLLLRRAGWHLQEARAINDPGQIAGYGILHGKLHAYLLTPIR